MTMQSITKNLGTFLLFVAIGAGISLGIRALVRGGGEANAEEPKHEHGQPAPKAEAPAKKSPAKTDVLVDLGNEKCPVMGGDVDGETYFEWRGLRIGFCCPGCDKGFLEKPEELLDKVTPGWRDVAEAAAKAEAAKGAARAKVLTRIGKRYRVLRPDPAVEKPRRVFVDLGNEKCPVMGGKVDGKTYTFWNGLRIGHCCPGCTKPLLEKPEELLDEMKLEWRGLAKSAALANAVEGKARHGLVAALEGKHRVVHRHAGLLIDLENEKCPVMGGKVDGKTYTEWNGLRIGHCCPGCTEPLLADPVKLLDDMGAEWREAAKLAALANNATGDARAKLVAEAKERFEVVRE